MSIAPPTPKTPPPSAAKAPSGSPPMAQRRTAPPPAGRSAIQGTVSRGIVRAGEKVLIYGAGKVGKTTLAAQVEQVGKKAIFIDVGESTSHMDATRYTPTPTTYQELRDALQDDAVLGEFDAVILDDLTTAEEITLAHVLGTKKGDGGSRVEGIEDFGWGKGYVHVFEASLALLCDLDRLARQGKDIIVVAHVSTENVKNPAGVDYPQYQPRLRSNKNAKFRERMMEWVYHCLFVALDTFVEKGGKATGGATRSIYTEASATHWAGSRSISGRINYPDGDDYAKVWRMIFGKS